MIEKCTRTFTSIKWDHIGVTQDEIREILSDLYRVQGINRNETLVLYSIREKKEVKIPMDNYIIIDHDGFYNFISDIIPEDKFKNNYSIKE